MKFLIKSTMIILGMIFSTSLLAEGGWKHGIGTGFYTLNIDGDLGLNTALGAVKADASMDFDEVREVLESALGLGGYSAGGPWVIQYSYGQMELEDGISGTIPPAIPASATLTFTAASGELSAIYKLSKAWGVLFGARYTKHEYDAEVTVGASTVARNLSESWTDGLLGLTHAHPISKTWIWNTRADVSFGDSDGGFFVDTGATWHFADSWSAKFYGSYLKHNYENGTRGDADWYLYDAAEFGVGANIIFRY